MYNNQMPQMQPVQPQQAPSMPQPSMPTGGGSIVEPRPLPKAPEIKEDHSTVIFIVVIVILSLLMVTFFGLFIWKLMDYNEVSTDVDGQIAVAVAAAKDEQATQDEQEFLEREKFPYQSFSGPADYGQLSFQYPKTWSVYIPSDASHGGDFEAYFSPVQVNAINNENINSLRLFIRNNSFENVAAGYQKYVSNPNSGLSMQTVTIKDFTANRYTGIIPGTNFNGFIVIIKIRDKTAILQTDSVLFEADFNRLLETIQFNA